MYSISEELRIYGNGVLASGKVAPTCPPYVPTLCDPQSSPLTVYFPWILARQGHSIQWLSHGTLREWCSTAPMYNCSVSHNRHMPLSTPRLYLMKLLARNRLSDSSRAWQVKHPAQPDRRSASILRPPSKSIEAHAAQGWSRWLMREADRQADQKAAPAAVGEMVVGRNRHRRGGGRERLNCPTRSPRPARRAQVESAARCPFA